VSAKTKSFELRTPDPAAKMVGSAGVYQIRNLQNDKRYIGSSVNLNKRWREHRSALNNNNHWNRHLQRSWNRHGSENFICEPLVTCHPSMRLWYEQQFLDQWKPEYNMAPASGSPLGVLRSAETKALISKAKTGQRCHVKLTERDVLEIRHRLVRGETSTLVATDYRVSSSTIRKIGNRTNWGTLV